MTDSPPFECGPECPAPDHHGRGPRAQGQTTPTAHVEIANDGPGQIYVGDPAQPASPAMMRQAEAPAGAPVYGPAAPTEADCAWATASTTAAMSAPECWFGTRQAYAEAEAATYAAAYHLGLDESAPAPPELEPEAEL
jgi:hypothetical protein